jgi:opacity protein-like surface antigen
MMYRNGFLTTVVLCCCCLVGTAGAWAAGPQRAQNWEGGFQVLHTGSENVDGSKGSSVDMDSAFGLGFDFNYNLDQNVALGFAMTWSRPDYDANYNSPEDGLVSISHRMTLVSGQFKGIWNLLNGPFTPYVEAGIGWNYVDSNVSNGNGFTGCYWDPWYGYVCRRFARSYNETELAYSFGAGLRYEFNNGMFIKGGLSRLEVDGGKFQPSLNSTLLELGWIFY